MWKPSGDSVVAGEAPHGRDLLAPGVQRIAESHQWGEPATTERGDIGHEALRQFCGNAPIPAFLEQQTGQPLFESVDLLQRRPLAQVCRQSRVLVGGEVVAVTAHERQQPAMLRSHWVQVRHAGA